MPNCACATPRPKKFCSKSPLLKAIEARNAVSLDAVLKQLNQLRGGQSSARRLACASAGNAGLRPGSQPAAGTQHCRAAGRRSDVRRACRSAARLRRFGELWTQLIEAVGRVSPFTRSYLVDAHPVSFEKNVLIIGFDPEFEDHLGLVDNARNHTLLQTKLAELGHPNCQIKFIKAEAPAGRVKPAAPTPVTAPVPHVRQPRHHRSSRRQFARR